MVIVNHCCLHNAQVSYCTQPLSDPPDLLAITSQVSDDGYSGGHASHTKLWVGRDVLWVYFMNPKRLVKESWMCGKELLNVQNIMDWAGAWNSPTHPNIPKFKKTDDQDKADIRVEFIGGHAIYIIIIIMALSN